MAKVKKVQSTEERFRRLQIEILFIFSVVIFVVTAFLTSTILEHSGTAMRQQVSTLIAANSRQLGLNIDSYLDNVETTAALLFSDEDYYMYDETDVTIDQYDKVKSEENIANRIVDIGLMENYSDFGIVYSDDHKVGWISKTTSGMFPEEGMYNEFAGYITDEHTNDGWVFGVHDNVDRLYYVKRMNPNAILIASFYTKELANVFRFPEELDAMTVRLVNDKNQILYSSTTDEIGEVLPDKIRDLIKEQRTATVIGEDYLVNTNSCNDNWQVVCAIPTDVILREHNELRSFTIYFAIILAVAMVAFGLIVIWRVSKPVDGMVSNLAVKATSDQLSGLLNKISFEEGVREQLSLHNPERYVALVVLDMDNFKQINDNLGHAYGDRVIARMGDLLSGLFYENVLIGRIGGDEFALFLTVNKNNGVLPDEGLEYAKKKVVEQLDLLLECFGDEFAREYDSCGISISAGVYIAQDTGYEFSTLYKKADIALYVSKRSGKNQYTIYREGMKGEEEKE